MILFAFTAHMLVAQNPGLMGKRFSFFLEANPTPAFLSRNMNNELITDPFEDTSAKVNRFAFNFRPQVTFEYLYSRDYSIGLSYSMIGTGTSRPSSDRPYDNSSEDVDADVIRGNSVGLHWKRYRYEKSASIAPIGFYQTLSVYATQTNTYDTKRSHTKQFKDDFMYAVVSFGIGRQSMIANKLLLKTGVEIGTPILSALDDTGTSFTEDAVHNVKRNLVGYYLFSFNVAIGYIPF